MSTTENPTVSPELDGAHMTPAGGEATVSDDSTLTLAELNQFLGKDFKDKGKALQSLKDTQSFVGKRREDIEAEVRASLQGATPPSTPPSGADAPASKSEVQSLKNDLFYSEHPQYKEHRTLIEKLGANPAEVVESPEFKAVFEKIQVADEVASKKSIVSSSPRLAQAKSSTDEAVRVANARGTSSTDVAEVLAQGINREASQG